ncbi:short chain dehydrogenase, putative, partial [Bodo saltans]
MDAVPRRALLPLPRFNSAFLRLCTTGYFLSLGTCPPLRDRRLSLRRLRLPSLPQQDRASLTFWSTTLAFLMSRAFLRWTTRSGR